MNFVVWMFLVGWNTVLCQDCLFYNPNSTDLNTGAFFGIPENVPAGTVIAKVDARVALRIVLKAVDDESVHRLLRVMIRDNASVEVIVSDSLSSLLPHTRALNFQLQCTGPSGAYASLPFLITILDVNDHAPKFHDHPYEAHISEFHGIGLPVIDGVTATDDDLPNTPNTEIQYSIKSGNELQYFGMPSPREGIITLQKKLDYESGPKVFQLNITASDSGSSPLSNWTLINIYVIDEDDQNPVFEKDFYEASIVEEIDEYMPVLMVRARDGDTGINETLKYEITGGLNSFLHHFSIDHVSGTISLLKAVDRERLPSAVLGYITLVIQATQDNDPTRTAKTAARIHVEDINDHGPRFLQQNISREIDILPSAFALPYMDLVQLTVYDGDTAENAAFVAYVESGIPPTNSIFPLLFLEPDEGVNQTMTLRVDNLTGLLQEAGSHLSLSVIAVDSVRNKRLVRSISSTLDPMQDIATIHITFSLPFPGLINGALALEKQGIPVEVKAFMEQYPVVLLTIFGALICLLLIIIAVMAGVFHTLKKQLRVSPLSVSDATSSTRSLTVSPSFMFENQESHA